MFLNEGPGDFFEVAVSDGESFSWSLWAEKNSAAPADPLAVGDFNGDGRDDIAVFTSTSGRSSNIIAVALSDGTSFSPWILWTTDYQIGASGLLAGDFNGDGRDDVSAFLPGGDPGGRFLVALSNGTGFGSQTQWQQGFAIGSANQLVGDFNGDEQDDIAAFFLGEGVDGRFEVSLSNGAEFSGWSTWQENFAIGSANQLVGDFDGDGRDDIAAFFASGGLFEVSLSDGAEFSEWDMWQDGFAIGSANQLVGDFNGDGRDDIAAFFLGGRLDGVLEVSLSNGAEFMHWDMWVEGFAVGSAHQLIGDFNGDNTTP